MSTALVFIQSGAGTTVIRPADNSSVIVIKTYRLNHANATIRTTDGTTNHGIESGAPGDAVPAPVS